MSASTVATSALRARIADSSTVSALIDRFERLVRRERAIADRLHVAAVRLNDALDLIALRVGQVQAAHDHRAERSQHAHRPAAAGPPGPPDRLDHGP